MKIHDFDITKGIYSFEFNELNTESHSHPVVEIISATEGTFSLQSNGLTIENLEFVIIESNTEHKVVSQNCYVRILMIESHNSQLSEFLAINGIKFRNGIFFKSNFDRKSELFSEVKNLAKTTDLKTPTDKRISDSRLSHLFKENIGISIKKYLVWNRLRQAINTYLNENTNLTDVSIQSGFFDQAHLTNSFKNVLGVSPSKAYNSRILQS